MPLDTQVKEAADRSEGGVILAADSKDRPTVGKVGFSATVLLAGSCRRF